MDMKYLQRAITNKILSRMKLDQVIVLSGARQTGKTTLCVDMIPQFLNLPFTYISFDDPDERLRFRHSGISILETIKTPLVILDEVQKIPVLFEHLKFVIDKQKRAINKVKKTFIITGSSELLLLKNIKETLAGRAALLYLFPFSLAEVLEYQSKSLLTQLWEGKKIKNEDIKNFDALSPEKKRTAMRMAKIHRTWGGFPPVWQREENEHKINWLKDYRTTYLERDISDVGQVSNLDMFSLVQKMLCSRSAQLLSISEIARDVTLAVNTVKRYINLLQLSLQCYLIPPFFSNISKRFVKSPKLYFMDNGLIKAILGEMSIHDSALYENWIFSELLKWKQLQAREPELFFYRTAAGKEIDFLLIGEQQIIPIEIKFSQVISSTDARNVISFLEEYQHLASTGIIVYPGKEMHQVVKNVWAIPDWFLFVEILSLQK
ncbi:MAG: hypothetical protein A2Y62_11555 [Candidatus Fischerbacteria bacterium RBG_13_37_8]|uniref:AAA+ ATPase domain-containing protein n=1 Tax=Candidatus Fischerbacteria bacterium RBG_13_37_8 TaxID=1817863 RepID=A0A1F5V5D1_9BACT|nr:MAG: hypothetical protein A2Y62_11555 [Candidatus Fischerbacteria bacterium RBG_13_37_8]